jgi:hypothetical protein
MTRRYQRGKQQIRDIDFCLPLWYLLVIVFSVLYLRVLFTSLVSTGHCIVYPLIYDFCLPLWYLLVIVLPVL